MIGDGWMNRKEAARYLTKLGIPTTPKRLAHLASSAATVRGPAYTRIGWRSVYYHVSDLKEWAIRVEGTQAAKRIR